MSRIQTFPLFLAAVVLTVLLPAGPAAAAEAGAARVLGGDGRVTRTSGACLLWSSSSGGYGRSCAKGRWHSFADLLRGAPAPTCWLLPAGATDLAPEDATPPSPLAAPEPAPPVPTPTPTSTPTPVAAPGPGPTAGPTPVTAQPTSTDPLPEPTPTARPPQEWTQVCITPPVNPVTGIPTGPIQFVTSTVVWSPDDPDRPRFWWELGVGQRAYADLREERASAVTVGRLVVSPVTSPRVRQSIAFSLVGTSAPTLPGPTQLRARLLGITVSSGEPGSAPVTCTGPGRVLTAGEVRRTGPDVCGYEYLRTSYDAGDGTGATGRDVFAARATSTWRVEFSEDDGATWQTFRDVLVPRTSGIRVSEVQTLVVP